MPDREFWDQFYANVAENIVKHGRHLMGVFPSKDDPPDTIPFAYTIGNYVEELPELLVFGLPPRACSMLNLWSDLMVKRGHPFRNGELIDIGGDFPCMAIDVVSPLAKSEYTIQATNFFGPDEDYRIIQILIPDQKGKFGAQAADPYCRNPVFGNLTLLP